MDRDPYVATTLLNVYIKCGRLQIARRVFDELELTYRNVITWTVMIGAYSASCFGVEAYRLFLQMKREGVIPDAFIYTSILNAYASAGALEWVKEVRSDAVRAGLESDVSVGHALVHMYAKSDSIDDARVVFDRMEKHDAITWTVLIGAYAGSGNGGEAYQLFLQVKQEGFIPNAVTYTSILNASASARALEWVKELHSAALKAGLESDLCLGNALVQMYAKSGSLDDARLVFDRLEGRHIFTWTVMIGAYAESGCGVGSVSTVTCLLLDDFLLITNPPADFGVLEPTLKFRSPIDKPTLGFGYCELKPPGAILLRRWSIQLLPQSWTCHFSKPLDLS